MQLSFAAFPDCRLGTVTVSTLGPTLAVLRRVPAWERAEQAESGLGRREWAELCAALGRAEAE